jgi:hypothetical protein
MSLRAFHLVFIVVSVVLAAFVGAWAVGQYRMVHEMVYAVTAGVAFVASAGLVAYAAMFQRKTRHLVALILMLAVPRAALACPVCFGNSDAPMAKAMNQGIWLMLGVVAFVLVGFASFFISLVRRARLADNVAPAEASEPQEGTA